MWMTSSSRVCVSNEEGYNCVDVWCVFFIVIYICWPVCSTAEYGIGLLTVHTSAAAIR